MVVCESVRSDAPNAWIPPVAKEPLSAMMQFVMEREESTQKTPPPSILSSQASWPRPGLTPGRGGHTGAVMYELDPKNRYRAETQRLCGADGCTYREYWSCSGLFMETGVLAGPQISGTATPPFQKRNPCPLACKRKTRRSNASKQGGENRDFTPRRQRLCD